MSNSICCPSCLTKFLDSFLPWFWWQWKIMISFTNCLLLLNVILPKINVSGLNSESIWLPFLAFQKMTDSCLGGKGGEGTIALTKDLKLPNTPKFAFVCFSLCSSFNFKMINWTIVHCQNASNFFFRSSLSDKSGRVGGECLDIVLTI